MASETLWKPQIETAARKGAQVEEDGWRQLGKRPRTANPAQKR